MDLLPVPAIDELPEMPWRSKLAYLTFMFHDQPQPECPLQHLFEDGKYIRLIAIPKGVTFIGRAHKIGHQVDLLTGSVIHVREKCRRLVHAPFTLHTKPMDQVCAVSLTDITARTVHPDLGLSDVEALESIFFETTQELRDLGEQVARSLRKRIYERSSSGDSGRSGGGDGRRLHCGW